MSAAEVDVIYFILDKQQYLFLSCMFVLDKIVMPFLWALSRNWHLILLSELHQQG